MSRIAAPIMLSPEERTALEAWAQSRTVAVRRARIILLAANGGAEPDHCEAEGDCSTDRAVVARPISGQAHGGACKGSSSPGSDPKNHRAKSAQDRGRHPPDEAAQRYAVEYADHGEGAGGE